MRLHKSGPIPRHHDLIEVAIMPLDSHFNPMKHILPFTHTIMPKRKYNIEDPSEATVSKEKLNHACVNGMEAYTALTLLDQWFEALGLNRGKKICPLVCSWHEDREFWVDWMTYETYDQYIDWRIRDISIIANYANDKADLFADSAPYPKQHFTYLCSQLKIHRVRDQDILEDCLCLAEVYKRMLSQRY